VPKLVLFADSGACLFEGHVSQEHVEAVAGFLRRHIAELRAVAETVQAFRRGRGQLEELLAGLTPASTRSNPRPRRRRAR
jgi:hypothetical protein